MASIYATGYLWLEQKLEVTSRMAAAIQIAASLGPDVFPVVLGQFIDSHPMSLMYLTFGSTVMAILLFAIASFIARKPFTSPYSVDDN